LEGGGGGVTEEEKVEVVMTHVGDEGIDDNRKMRIRRRLKLPSRSGQSL
jgi:hypothetical protein